MISIFNPSSIAVIGASRHPNKLGHTILKNIIKSNYKGKIYPVNPNAKKIFALKCYPDVTSIPGKIDLLIFSVPAPAILPILKSAVESRKGVKSALIITAGFKEIGLEGARMEKEIQQIFKQNNIRAIGPNCVGFIDTVTPLNATFSATDKMPPSGQIAFFAQSGALSMAILDWAIKEKIGISKLVSLGNKIDVDEVSLLEYLSEDKEVGVILGYLESIDNGRGFMDIATRVSRSKPIIIVKGGSTAAGSRAASSHTGSLAGQDHAYQSAFIQSGVIRVETITELFDIARAFVTYSPLPPEADLPDGQAGLPQAQGSKSPEATLMLAHRPASGGKKTASDKSKPQLRGPNIAIVTNSGGPAVMAADRIEKSSHQGAGLKMASFSESTINKLRNNFPPGANVYNPVDVIADASAERYQLAINEVYNDKNVDGILVIYTPASKEQPEYIARTTVEIFRKAQKPILTSFMGGEIASRGVEIIKQAGIPNYPSPERAIKAFEAMFQHYLYQHRAIEHRVKNVVSQDGRYKTQDIIATQVKLTTDEVLKIISNYGINIPDFKIAQSLEQVEESAEKIGYPVVLKIVSPDISHKTDFGGVRLNLHTPADLKKAYREIMEGVQLHSPQAIIKGVMIQKMVTGGKEVIIGMSRDHQFGPLIMFGLGGIYVEVLKDVSFRLAPLTMFDVDEMIREVKTYPLLKGIRGEEPSDLNNLKETILKVSQLVVDFPQIAELDINPYKLFAQGGVAIDARITIS